MVNGVNGVSPVILLPVKGCDKCECEYATVPQQKVQKEEVDPSMYGQIMKNLALASMMLTNRNNAWRQALQQNQLVNDMNLQMEQQNIMMNNMLMHQQAMQDHMTAVQMSTPGMGFI